MTRVCLIAALLWLGCSSHENPRLVLSNATVELDAFSGRPNPRWRLSAEEARDLSARLRGLEPADGAKFPAARLGYRGFYIDNVDGQRVYITHGLIGFMRGDQPPTLYRDTRGAEAALKEQARARGHGAVFGAR